MKTCSALLLFFFVSGCCNEAEIPQLLQKLDSVKTREKTEAALALAKCGEDGAGAVTKLSRLIYDENPGVQSAAAYALRKIDTPAARAVMEQVDNRKRNNQR